MSGPAPTLKGLGYRYDIYQYRSPQRLVDPRTGQLVDLWQTVAPFDVWLPNGQHIRIPAGFVFDKASVPRLVWAYLPRDDKHVVIAALVHDYLYVLQKIQGEWIKRSQADQIFFDLCRAGGMRYSKAKTAYLGVRSGGWVAFNKRAKTRLNSHYVEQK